MFVKKFEAPSIEKALELIKHELGPDALILSTSRKKEKWFQKPVVEVTAAVEKKGALETKKLEEIFPHRKNESDGKKLRSQKYVDIEADPTEVRTKRNPAQKYEESFLKVGISPENSRELSMRLAHDYPKSDLQVVTFLEKARIRLLASGLRALTSAEVVSKGGSWVAIGTAGAGKTSLLVKLALHLKNQEHLGVSLVSADERKLIARSEMSAYAKLIKVPFHTDSTDKSGKMSLIDSPALSLKESEDSKELSKLIKGDRSVVVVLDATARLNELRRVLDYCLQFSPKAVAFTRLDLVAQRGILYDILKGTKLPLIGLSESHSFKVPFRFLSPTELAAYILARRGNHE